MQDQLVVIVKNDQGVVANAGVQIDETKVSGTTDASGQVMLNLPPDRIQVTISITINGDTVQTPFYIVPDGARRLEVNFPYLKQLLQEQSDSTPGSQSVTQAPNFLSSLGTPVIVGGVIALVLIVVLAVMFMRFRERIFRKLHIRPPQFRLMSRIKIPTLRIHGPKINIHLPSRKPKPVRRPFGD